MNEYVLTLKRLLKAFPEEAIDRVEVNQSNEFKLHAMSGLLSRSFNKKVNEMTPEELNEACNLVDSALLPADIIVSDTVPIKDIEMTYHDDGDGDYKDSETTDCRIVIFDKDKWYGYNSNKVENVKTFTSEKLTVNLITCVGAITLIYSKTRYTSIPIIVSEHSDGNCDICLEAFGAFMYNDGSTITLGMSQFQDMGIYAAMRHAMLLLTIWYSIQVSLLNPLIRYKTTEKQKIIHPKKSRSGRKKSGAPKIKYFKTIHIEEEAINEFFEETKNEKGEINRHCLMWYVTGHWRQYKNGKKIFIQGYWKGEGRFSGIEAQTRQRELVLDENDLPKKKKPIPREPAKRLLVDSSYYENVKCKCGRYQGEEYMGDTCDTCHTVVMYRKGN